MMQNLLKKLIIPLRQKAQCEHSELYSREYDQRLEMCQYDTDAPVQGHPQPHTGILQKMKLKKGTN